MCVCVCVTYQPYLFYEDRALNQRYRDHLKYACYWVTLGPACTLHTNHSNFTLISRTTPFPKFGDIHTLVYEDQKNQPLGLVPHRRCRDRPVIQHVPNWKSKALPSFFKLTSGFLFQEPSSRLYKLSRYCDYTPTLRGPDPQFTCNSKLCKSIFFNNRSAWDLLTAPLMFPQKAQEMW